MLYLKKIVFGYFILIVGLLQGAANSNQLQTYIGLSFQNQIKRGYVSAFAFHNHNPRFGNSNFHVHNNCNPFVKGKEVLQALSLNAEYVVNQKIAVAVSLPYSLKTQLFADSVNLFRNGIGDVKLGFRYALFESSPQKLFTKVKHQTILSIYVKFKTGKYNQTTTLNDIDPHLQNGLGSTNWQTSLQHFINFNKWNLSGAINYQLFTKNYFQFKKGNVFEAKIAGAYHFNINDAIIFLPALQLSYQNKKADTMETRKILKPTSYQAFLLGANAAFQYKKIIFNLSYSIPVYLSYDTVDLQCKAPEQHQNIKAEIKWLWD